VRDRGIAVVLVSHNMPEVMKVSDRIEVLRLGRRVATFSASEASMEDLVGAMTGAISGNGDPDDASAREAGARSGRGVS
jgi:simple sugar transport system ATP-binding protein